MKKFLGTVEKNPSATECNNNVSAGVSVNVTQNALEGIANSEVNDAKRLCEEQEPVKKKQKISDIFALVSMICGIAGIALIFIPILCFPAWVCAIVFGIIALVKKTRKKGFAITGLVFAGLLLTLVIWAMTSPDESVNNQVVSEEQEEKRQRFFDIVQMINDGKYDEAATNIQTYYGDYDYKSAEGINKVSLQRFLYHEQEKWDDEMQGLLDYLEANKDFKDKLQKGEVNDDVQNLKFVISCASDIIDLVSPQKKQEAIELIGQELLDEYK